MAKRPGIQLNMPINGNEAFNFQKNSCEPVGFIRTWTFSTGEELIPDLTIRDPENPNNKLTVVAVLHSDPGVPAAYWEGGPTDQMDLKGLLSYENAAILDTCINKNDSGTDQSMNIGITNHDDKKDVFYKAIDTEAPLKVVFTPDVQCNVSNKPNQDVPEPRNYTFSVSVTAKGKAGEQKINCAKSSELKTVKQFGGAATPA